MIIGVEAVFCRDSHLPSILTLQPRQSPVYQLSSTHSPCILQQRTTISTKTASTPIIIHQLQHYSSFLPATYTYTLPHINQTSPTSFLFHLHTLKPQQTNLPQTPYQTLHLSFFIQLPSNTLAKHPTSSTFISHCNLTSPRHHHYTASYLKPPTTFLPHIPTASKFKSIHPSTNKFFNKLQLTTCPYQHLPSPFLHSPT